MKGRVYALGLAGLLLGGGLFAAAPEAKNVLILNSYRPGFEWTDELFRGIRAALSAEPYEIELWVEYMDAARYSGDVYLEHLSRLLSYKYAGRKLDVIVTTDDDALAYLLPRHSQRFGDTPVVYCGVNDPRLAAQAPRGQFTGVLEVFDSKELLELAVRLHPGTQRIYVVTGPTPTSRVLRETYEELAGKRPDLRFTFLDARSLTLAEILDALRKAEPHSLVLTTAVGRDRTGAFLRVAETLEKITRASPVPVYSPSLSSMERGLVAGSENGGFRHGQIAGRLAARILRGDRPEQIPPETDSENRFLFDYQQMRRWGIEATQLPYNAVLVNRPASFYQENKALIWGGALFIAFQAAVIAGLVVNIARRRSAVQAQARLAAILEATPDVVGMTSRDGRVLYLNRAGRLLLGIAPDEDLRPTLARSYYPDWARRIVRQGSAHAVAHGVWFGETALLTRAGREVPVSQVILAHKDDTGAVSFFSTIARDITERQQSEEALRQSEDKFSKAFRSSPDALAISTLRQGRYLEVNEGYLRVTGHAREEVIGHTVAEINFWADPEDRTRLVREVEEHGRVENADVRFRTKSGDIRRGLFSAEAIELAGERCWLTVMRDITEFRRLEEQFLQAQKMEAIGRLAGGVAHDFNNLLTVIQGYGEVAVRGLHPSDAAATAKPRAALDEIRKAADRAAGLTKQLLSFSRKQVVQTTMLDLNAEIRDLSRMLQRIIGENIELRLELQETALVRADPGLMHQVLMNLVVNARDAMPGGGRITISAANLAVDAGQAQSYGVAAGRYVALAVADTGIGMDEATRRRVFEPFFTTKDMGKGTGLGLATVYGIVQQSGGQVLVESQVGKGTTFRIYLPALDARPLHSPPTTATRLQPGSETVLLVEDEAAVRQLTQDCLAAAGYQILSASDGQEALELCRSFTARIHLLVSDVVLPGISGPALAEQLRRVRPDMQVLFLSGYANEAFQRHAALPDGVALLQKPFGLSELTRRVREVLDASG